MSAAAHMENMSSKVIPAQRVRVHDGSKCGSAAWAALPESAAKLAEPKIHLLKDGNVVTAIEITCTCGAVIHLDCEY